MKNYIITSFILVLFIYWHALKAAGNESIYLTKAWETDTLLRIPESVIYDKEANFLYVSNINGSSREKDGNGFISRLSTSGKIEKLEWIKGLDSPKGLGIYKRLLYVADLTQVIIIDIQKEAIINRIPVEGALFLNDITVSKTGEVYITDSGNKKIYLLKDNQIRTWSDQPELDKPNGILSHNNELLLLDMTKGNLYQIKDGKKPLSTPKTQTLASADGIVAIGKDEFIVSNWNGQIYHVSQGKVSVILDTREQKKNAADIWYIADQKLLLVPTFFGNTVSAYKLQ